MQLRSLCLIILALCLSNLYGQETQDKKKTKVMILAVFHFVSNNDAIKFPKENMLIESRQKEIDDLNTSLWKFHPDKIFIEWQPSAQKRVDSTYVEYTNGRFTLTANEVHQIGFKLGKLLSLSRVYCMDAPGLYRFDTVRTTARKSGQIKAIDSYFNEWRNKALIQDSLQRLMTVKERLRVVNNPKNIFISHELNAGVLTAPYVGQVGDYAGAEFMGEWYKRNIRMYSNIVRQIDKADNSILIIVGAGHARILQHFFEDNPMFELVSAEGYLK